MRSTPTRPAVDGWRGVLAREITFDKIAELARACATVAQNSASHRADILVGYDTRFLSRELADCAAKAISEIGLPVQIAVRPAPTPLLSWQVAASQLALGLVITASHSPASYSGLKARDTSGAPLSDASMAAIEHQLGIAGQVTVIRPARRPRAFSPVPVDPVPGYIRAVTEQVDIDLISRRVATVAVDVMHGTTAGLLKTILRDSHTQVAEVRNRPDPLFGGIAPEPKDSTLGPLRRAMKSAGASLGFAHDGDGDRVLGLDHAGRFLDPTQIGLMIALDLVTHHGQSGAIVGSVTASRRLARFAARIGVPYHEVPIGFRHASAIMRESPVLVAVEENGGIGVAGHIPERDGTFAALRLIEAVARQPLDQLHAKLNRLAGPAGVTSRWDMPTEDADEAAELLQQFTARLPQTIDDRRVVRCDLMDGTKLTMDDGSWILLRAASTEPMLRIYAEASSDLACAGLIRTVVAELSGPAHEK